MDLEVRNKAVDRLAKSFPKKIARKIEEGLNAFTEQYCASDQNYLTMGPDIYQHKLDDLIGNCERNETLDELKGLMISGEFDPYNLAFLKPHELNAENWRKIVARRFNTEEKLRNLPAIEGKPCKMCGCTQFFYRQLQTRSADEPMTTFHICKQCGKTIRF